MSIKNLKDYGNTIISLFYKTLPLDHPSSKNKSPYLLLLIIAWQSVQCRQIHKMFRELRACVEIEQCPSSNNSWLWCTLVSIREALKPDGRWEEQTPKCINRKHWPTKETPKITVSILDCRMSGQNQSAPSFTGGTKMPGLTVRSAKLRRTSVRNRMQKFAESFSKNRDQDR